VRTTRWWTIFENPGFILDNYAMALAGGNTQLDLAGSFVNSIVNTLTATLTLLMFASMAAYAFAWIDFRGKDILFIGVFALPLTIYLLHNFVSEIPARVIEAARVDGAGHAQIFFRIVLPLNMPAIASIAIFPFIWVWNDLLVALIFADGVVTPMTKLPAELSGARVQAWYLLTAAAFLSTLIPVIVFLSLQRYFVRGMLAGATKR
jgi:alpha-glucoside transport system permease protein